MNVMDLLNEDCHLAIWQYLNIRDKMSWAAVNRRRLHFAKLAWKRIPCLELCFGNGPCTTLNNFIINIDYIPLSSLANLFRYLSNTYIVHVNVSYYECYIIQNHFSTLLEIVLQHFPKMHTLICNNINHNVNHGKLFSNHALYLESISFNRMTPSFYANFSRFLLTFPLLTSLHCSNLYIQGLGPISTKSPLCLPILPLSFQKLTVYGELSAPLREFISSPLNLLELNISAIGPNFHDLSYNYDFILNFKNLTTLRIPFSTLTDYELITICSELKDLTRLDISACFNLSEYGLKYLPRLTKLRYLSVAYLSFDNACFNTLHLDVLDVSFSNMLLVKPLDLFIQLPQLQYIMYEADYVSLRKYTVSNLMYLDSAILNFQKFLSTVTNPVTLYIQTGFRLTLMRRYNIHEFPNLILCDSMNPDTPSFFSEAYYYYSTIDIPVSLYHPSSSSDSDSDE